MKNEVVKEIISRLEKAFEVEKQTRKLWISVGFSESTAPSALGLIGNEKEGYECMRSKWWRALGYETLANDFDYFEITREVEKSKIPNMSFGS